MPSLLSEARHFAPELTDAIKTLDKLAYTRQYSEVFADLIDWLIYEHSFPPENQNPLAKKYNEKEQILFKEIFQHIRNEVKKRINLWTAGSLENYHSENWYDSLGAIYETITSKFKSKMLGQFFTPVEVVNFMTQITDPGKVGKIETILDPCSGSGRFGLAAASHAMSKGAPTWVSLVDIDPICAKMSVVNMAMNGIVGEAINMDALDIRGDSFRFGYRVAPLLSLIPPEKWELAKMMGLFTTGQDVKKQYIIQKIPYEQTHLKGANDRLLEELKERQKIADEKERVAAVEELKNKVKARMAGSLFEQDDSILDNIKLPSEMQQTKKGKSSKSKIQSSNSDNKQGSLF